MQAVPQEKQVGETFSDMPELTDNFQEPEPILLQPLYSANGEKKVAKNDRFREAKILGYAVVEDDLNLEDSFILFEELLRYPRQKDPEYLVVGATLHDPVSDAHREKTRRRVYPAMAYIDEKDEHTQLHYSPLHHYYNYVTGSICDNFDYLKTELTSGFYELYFGLKNYWES